METIVHLVFQLVEPFFKSNSLNEKLSKKIKRTLIGFILFLICMLVLISYIVISHENFSITR